ncbi:ribosome small subunit-dependent GTPase A [Abyssalbus ytuae]|uniref:Small ribosomal subunit biogenesis GTPase RsgA n=1 Tax=Abyssalbus ytuae TaxID=2926907 RepID=A0A9E6ZMM0_9FLAO|nr:ribosome small subunit-dependent GTPase A [Abyssalbus ytuae]UOB17025.1 ribosome small subunit-dependent GTPase A [Abyssalbus ytuae]
MTATNNKKKTSLYDLGYNPIIDKIRQQKKLEAWEIGRVTAEHKERYSVKNENGEYESEIIGNLRFTVQNRLDFPAVGDWVTISGYDDSKALIHHILYRKNALKRQAVGKKGETQIIATNVDYAFIVEAVNRDFSINRFERYLAICYDANIEPVLILNKIDLLLETELNELVKKVKKRIPKVLLVLTSCNNEKGLLKIQKLIQKGKTYCFLGSSGVGKSSLINLISKNSYMKTGEISYSTDRGKHVTSHRELIVLEQGGILIDNPGMREVGVTDVKKGLENSFELITELSSKCKYKNCSHEHEKGCAVLLALQEGKIDNESYTNYLKMEKERKHFQYTEAEKRQQGKKMSKMIKQYKKGKKMGE